MKQSQQEAKHFVEKNALSNEPGVRMLDAMSELGELAKALLSSSNYGEQPVVNSKSIEEEVGDVLFSVLCLCNALQIDGQVAFERAMDKYQERLKAKGEISSGK